MLFDLKRAQYAQGVFSFGDTHVRAVSSLPRRLYRKETAATGGKLRKQNGIF
jgi:hypothetical protein